MTIKDLFKLIFKLFGLFTIIELVTQIPSIIFSIQYDSSNYLNWLTLVIIAVFILIIYILIFKADHIIRVFKLDKGFENQSNLTIYQSTESIFGIASVIIAVYLIVNNLADFINQIIFSFKESISDNDLDTPLNTFNPNPTDYSIMIRAGLNICIGFLLLTNITRFSKWIERINKKMLVDIL